MKTEIKVVKKDGSLEDFNQEKISKVVVAAGLNEKEARSLTAAIALWIKDNKFAQVESLILRDKVVQELQKINPYTANFFAWYEKTKDKS